MLTNSFETETAFLKYSKFCHGITYLNPHNPIWNDNENWCRKGDCTIRSLKFIAKLPTSLSIQIRIPDNWSHHMNTCHSLRNIRKEAILVSNSKLIKPYLFLFFFTFYLWKILFFPQIYSYFVKIQSKTNKNILVMEKISLSKSCTFWTWKESNIFFSFS